MDDPVSSAAASVSSSVSGGLSSHHSLRLQLASSSGSGSRNTTNTTNAHTHSSRRTTPTHSRTSSRAASPTLGGSILRLSTDHDNDDGDEEDSDSEADPDHEVIPVVNSSLDDDWDSDDEDEAGLRRYHFVPSASMHTHHGTMTMSGSSAFPSLPAEFDDATRPWWERLHRRLQAWQRAARQRRAARLLSTLQSDAPCHRVHLCALTWCWDSTDRSIALLLGFIVAWLVLGLIGRLGATWWWTGVWMLVVRLGTRPLCDAIRRGKPGGGRARWRHSSTAVALSEEPPRQHQSSTVSSTTTTGGGGGDGDGLLELGGLRLNGGPQHPQVGIMNVV